MKNRLEYFGLRAVASVTELVPYRWLGPVAGFLGWLLYRVFRIRAGVAEMQLRKAFPDFSPQKVQSLVGKSYRQFILTTLEFLNTPSLPRDFEWSKVFVEREEELLQLLGEKNGMVTLSAHFGNWELAGGYFLKNERPVTIVYKQMRNPLVSDWIDRKRVANSLDMVEKDDSMKPLISALRRGELIAILPDQDPGIKGMETTLFGIATRQHLGPFQLAERCQVPVLYMVVRRNDDGTITFRWRMGNSEGTRSPAENMAEDYTRWLENEIRWSPWNWLWVHKRWKSSPEIQYD